MPTQPHWYWPTSTFQAVNVLGLPEARIPLSQCAIYLAGSEKSNAFLYPPSTRLNKPSKKQETLGVPLPLRNAAYPTDEGTGSRQRLSNTPMTMKIISSIWNSYPKIWKALGFMNREKTPKKVKSEIF
jgi:hypothetical protein